MRFNESAKAAQESVEKVLESYGALARQLDEEERGKLQRSMGMKMEQLKVRALMSSDSASLRCFHRPVPDSAVSALRLAYSAALACQLDVYAVSNELTASVSASCGQSRLAESCTSPSLSAAADNGLCTAAVQEELKQLDTLHT